MILAIVCMAFVSMAVKDLVYAVAIWGGPGHAAIHVPPHSPTTVLFARGGGPAPRAIHAIPGTVDPVAMYVTQIGSQSLMI